MRALVLGSGGREHAIAWGLARSAGVSEVTTAPGNGGTIELGPYLEVDVADTQAVVEAAARFDLVVVGPEAPLAGGVADALRAEHIPVVGPSAAGARLEASKSFAKEIMEAAGVPTARAATHRDPHSAKADLADRNPPFVVKADGLAAGKGVLVTDHVAEAASWVDHCFGGGFGEAGTAVVVEDFLAGEELSVMAAFDGHDLLVMQPARDYKRLGDGDEGPNTGGMGAYSPVADVDPVLVDEVATTLIAPTLAELASRDIEYRGFLYAGLMLTPEGPKVLEFNVRLGDPEAQVLLPRLRTDLSDLCMAIAAGSLSGVSMEWDEAAAVDVVIAAPGYPERPEPGQPIAGLDAVPEDVLVFHSGTAWREGNLVTAGGRVLNLVGIGAGVADAAARAYRALEKVGFPGMVFRGDIGRAA